MFNNMEVIFSSILYLFQRMVKGAILYHRLLAYISIWFSNISLYAATFLKKDAWTRMSIVKSA